jgi:hypothetical protein
MLAGALIIAGLVALLAATFVVNRVMLFFEDRYTIVAIVPEAPLLTNGSKVWIGGKAVGTVEGIGFLPHDADTVSRISMRLNLPTSVAQQVRRDSRVRITTARLVGERVVDIIPGSPGAPMLREGDTLKQRNAVTVAQLTATAATVKAQLDTALVDVRAIMPLVHARLAETQRVFATLDGAMADGKKIAADARSGPGLTLMHDPAFAASIQRVRGHVAALPPMFSSMREKSASSAEARAAFGRLQLRADTLGKQLALISDMLNSPNGSAARFRQDSALVKALRAARTDLDSLMAETRRNPLRFIF